nr:zinc finger, CCHC-type [Tanacetum cinerariifolium]
MLKPSNYSLWEMIEPLETTKADNKKDKTAIAFLYQALPEEQLFQITKHKTAKAIWDALKTRHIGEQRVQQARLQTLKSNFEMLHIKEDETIDTFTRKLTTLVNKAASLGHTIEDSVVVRKLLNAVHDKFLQIVASIEQYSDLDEMSKDEAIGRLKTFEERLKQNVVGEDLTSLKAENKIRTIINLKGKNERLLKKIQETNLKSHVTDVTNLDTMPMNVQTNARIKSENNPILLKKT